MMCRYGEIVNINLVRDKKTGNSKGFCFLAYEDQRSTILAVDNLNAIKVSLLASPHQQMEMVQGWATMNTGVYSFGSFGRNFFPI